MFLALYTEALKDWAARITEAIAPGIGDDAAIEAIAEMTRSDPLFIALASRMSSVIEHNVPMSALAEAKRSSLPVYMSVARRLEECLGLAAGDGLRFGSALMALLLGAAEIDTGDLAMRDDLPEDIRDFVAMSRFETVFGDGVRLLLAGLRKSG